ncbi:MAG: AMP-binding protein, partial [Chthoniobacteraceae bacterium]
MSVIQNRDRTSSQTLIVPEPGTVGGREAFVDSLVEAQAHRTPDAIALVCGDRRLPYRELDRRAAQVADVLSALGVGPGALAAICVERSLDMVVGLLGILKAGGAYLPLDPNLPAER